MSASHSLLLRILTGLVAIPALLAAGPNTQESLSEDAAIAVLLDREGTVLRRGVLAARWSAVEERTRLMPGDWLKTGARGAHAGQVGLTSGAGLIAGPGGLVELVDGATLRPAQGEFAVLATPAQPVTVIDRRGTTTTWNREVWLRAEQGDVTVLDREPRWLTGYRSDHSTEALGSLLAQVDGRSVELSVGAYQVTVDVRDQIARTVVEETFVNHTPHVLEGVFYFPLPADASISSFAMWIGNQRIEGEIVEKQRARAIYETILREKRDPGLLEWAGGNLFKARVYPIGRDKRIRLSYTQVLPLVDGAYRYHHALQSEHLQQNPLDRLRVEVNVASARGVGRVECPSHPARIRTSEHGAVVEFEAEDHVPDRDLEVVVRPAPSAQLVHTLAHRRGEDGYFMVLFEAPEVATPTADPEPLEVVVLADTSGSMDGPARVAQVRFVEALFESLSESDRVNLLTCDTEVRRAFPDTVPCTADHRARLLDHLEARAPLGWSDLPAALDAVLDAAAAGSHVVYVGDGVVTSGRADAAELARRLRERATDRFTVHAVVPGAMSDPVVLQALAAHGPGTVRTIPASGNPADEAARLLGEIAAPAVEDLKLRIDGLPVAAVHPARLPALPSGAQQIVVGRYDPAMQSQSGDILITGTSRGKPFQVTARLDLRDADQGNSFLPRLWARRHLDFLIAQGDTPTVRETAIGLSEDFQILTPWTSFLVLESEADRERFQLQKRFRMRDGEEFFTEGRDQARFELLRDQMQKARAWRLDWKRRAIEELSGMARDLTLRVGGSGQWGPSGGYALEELGAFADEAQTGLERQDRGAADLPFKRSAIREQEEEQDADLESLDPAEEPVDRSLGKKEALARDDDGASFRQRPAAGGGSAGRGPSTLGPGGPLSGPGDSMRARSPMPYNPLDRLFPAVPAVAMPPTPDWPEDVQQALRALDHADLIESVAGGWRFAGRETVTDGRGRELEGASYETLLSRDRWWTESAAIPGQTRVLQWVDEEQRGIVLTTWDLGRIRTAQEADRTAWASPLSWSLGPSKWQVHGVERATVEETADRQRIVAEGNDFRYVIEIDRELGAVVEVTVHRNGEVQWRQTFAGFVPLEGAWWPTLLTVDSNHDGAPHTRQVTQIAIERLDAATFTAALQQRQGRLEGAVLLGAEPADQPEALLAYRQQPTLENTWFLLRHYSGLQQWTRSEEFLDAFLQGVGDRFGRFGVLSTLGSMQRRGDESLEVARTVAAQLAGRPRVSEYATVLDVLGKTRGVVSSPHERLGLLQDFLPVALRQPPILDAEAQLRGDVAATLGEAGRRAEALAMHRDLAARFPWLVRVHLGLADELNRQGDPDAAVAHLEDALDRGPWSENEQRQLRQKISDVLWNSYQLERFLRMVTGWQADDDAFVDALVLNRFLSALIMTGHQTEASRRIEEWLAPSTTERSATTDARLSAALSHAQGHGVNLQGRYGRYRAEQLRWLVETVRRFRDQPDRVHHATQILSDYYFRRLDEAQALLQEAESHLRDELPRADARLIAAWVQWLRYGEIRWRDREVNWEVIEQGLLQRWRDAADDGERTAFENLLSGASSPCRLTYLREALAREATAAGRRPRALALVQFLLTEAPQTEGAAEFTRLFTILTDPVQEMERGGVQDGDVIVAAYRYTDWLIEQGTARLLEAVKDSNTMTRREWAAQQELARRQAEAEALRTLRSLEDAMSGRLLADWVTLDRVFLEVPRQADLAERQAEMLALLARRDGGDESPDTEPGFARTIATTRALTVLAHLAASFTDQDREEWLYELLKTREHDPFSPARQIEFLVMLARDRVERLRTQLTRWSDEQTSELRNLWLRRLAHVEAETGDLEQAVRTLRAAGGVNDLGAAEVDALVGWLTALDRPEEARAAKLESLELLPEHELGRLLQQRAANVRRTGTGIVEALDPDAPLELVALFHRANEPANHLWTLNNLWGATRDDRLLECLPEAVLGRTSQAIYGVLDRLRHTRGLLDELDEATVDRLVQHLRDLRHPDRSAVERRALTLLEVMVEVAAARQAHGVRDHVMAAERALREVLPQDLADGEPIHLANFLADLDAPQHASLVQVQLDLLEKLFQATAARSEDRVQVAVHWARALWANDRKEPAVTLLQSARTEFLGDGDRRDTGALDALVDALSRDLVASARHEEAESLWREERGRARTPLRGRYCLTRWLEVYVSAVEQRGRTSRGDGAGQYAAVREFALRALQQPEDEATATAMIDGLRRVFLAASDQRLGDAAQDATRFAFGALPAILDLYQFRRSWEMVADTAAALQVTAGARVALEFLVVRAENEAVWLTYTENDFWRHHGYLLAKLRPEAGALDPAFSERLLAVVLHELHEDLTSGRARRRDIYDRDDGLYWKERHADFVAAARAAAVEVRDSGGRVLHVARYVFHDLHERPLALEILWEAEHRDLLTLEGQQALVEFLHLEKRHRESIPLLVGMIEERPADANFRALLMDAYFHTQNTVALVQAADEAEQWFRDAGLWNEPTVARLALASVGTERFERAVRYYDEAIALHTRARSDRGNGDGTLSDYYWRQSTSYGRLGRTASAVDAAAGAIIAWGRDQGQRDRVLANLVQVLERSPDLDEYVAAFETQIRETGLENPIVRAALGRVFLNRRDLERARHHLELAVETRPEDATLYRLLIQVLDQAGQAEAAAACTRDMLRHRPREATSYRELGQRYARLERPGDAERAYTHMVEMLPEEADSHASLAGLFVEEGRLAEAEIQWRQVIRVRTDEPAGYLGLAATLRQEGKRDELETLVEDMLGRTWDKRFGDVHGQARAMLQARR